MSPATEVLVATANVATNGTVSLVTNVLFNIMQHKTVVLALMVSLALSLSATALAT
jgi:hypothetical protein